MPTNFPSGLDNFTNPTAADNLNSVLVPHADQHANENDAIEALEAKVGIDGSLVTGSLDYRVSTLESQPSHSPVTLGISNGLSLSGQQLSMGLAGANSTGTLSAADWNTFNSKQSTLTFPLASSLGGTSIANTGTFTNHSNTTIIGGGTLSLGGFTLTIPASGTAALGTGAENQFGYWSGANTLTSSANYALSTSVISGYNTLTIGQGASAGNLGALRLNGNNGGVATVFEMVPGGSDAYFKTTGANGFTVRTSNSVSFRDSNDQKQVAGFTPGTGNLISVGYTTGWPGIVSGVALTVSGGSFSDSNIIKEVLRLDARVTNGAATTGFGISQKFFAETATEGTIQQMGEISTSWITATNATRKAKMSLSAYDTAARLGIEIEASGTAVKLGFFGGTTAVQQTLNAYTSDGEGAAYTGIDNAQAGTVYATVADLNQLRTAYETLRASYDDLRTKLQTSTIVA